MHRSETLDVVVTPSGSPLECLGHLPGDTESETPQRVGDVKVCHVAMGDLWAGAEAQLLSLMRYLTRLPGFEWSVILFNEGRLAEELRKLPVSLTIIPERAFNPLGIAYHLGKTLRHIRPDIVHTHKYKDSFIGTTLFPARPCLSQAAPRYTASRASRASRGFTRRACTLPR